ncbi:hypothetical protein [Methylocapsa acidiphila]|uniref:hypothetical protein n=1 Tax=Methylocapsa acidiphila TaxID=133552 RepID=UPI0004139690|nr:hypothetical protein [Methylocapsa acidiphila]
MSDAQTGIDVWRLRVHRDHIYIDAADFTAHLANAGNVILLREGGDLLVLPLVSAAAGGFLVKQVNARGDRAIHAADFFRLNGIDERDDLVAEAVWSEARAGYVIGGFFAERPES